jgi:hypothetical protein
LNANPDIVMDLATLRESRQRILQKVVLRRISTNGHLLSYKFVDFWRELVRHCCKIRIRANGVSPIIIHDLCMGRTPYTNCPQADQPDSRRTRQFLISQTSNHWQTVAG